MDAYIWLALMLVFLVIEAACPFHLVSIWFAVGALAAAVAAWLGGVLWLQILLFALVSCGLLIGLWPFTKKILSPRIVKTNVDSIVGTEGYVTQSIDNIAATGQVKLGGMEWTARSASGQPIAIGTLVKVEKIEGVKVIVATVSENAEVEV